MNKMEKNNGPLARFKAGGVTAAVWDNSITVKGNIRSIKKVTLERRYMDKSGNWKSSNSFGRDEVALAKFCLDKAFEFMLESTEGEANDEGN